MELKRLILKEFAAGIVEGTEIRRVRRLAIL